MSSTYLQAKSQADRILQQFSQLYKYGIPSLLDAYSVNSSSILRSMNDKNVPNFSDPSDIYNRLLAREKFLTNFYSRVEKNLNLLSGFGKNVLMDKYIYRLTPTQIGKKYNFKNKYQSIEDALLSYAAIDEEIPFDSQQLEAYRTDRDNKNRREELILKNFLETIDRYKEGILATPNLVEEKTRMLPEMKPGTQNFFFLGPRIGYYDSFYKYRSVLCLGLYWLDNPEVTEKIIYAAARKLGWGISWLKSVKNLIDAESSL